MPDSTWLEYYGVTVPNFIAEGVNRGDGVIGTFKCPAFDVPLPGDATIEAAIHALIGASETLTTLLAADFWVTGIYDGESPTYCTINQDGGSPKIHMNDGRIDDASIRFQVFASNHALGKRIQRATIDFFDNLSFDLTGQNGDFSILYARVQNNFALQDPDRTWQFLTDITFWSD